MGAALYFTAPGFTLTIPSPDSLGIPANSGKYFKLFGLNQSTGTIASGAGVAIDYNVGDVKKIVIKQGQFLTLMATAGKVWQVIDSTAEMWRNADFTGVLAGNGHKCLPDDFIMQWQTVDVPVATTGIATKNFSFPIAFKEAVFGCTASVLGIGAASNSNAFVAAMGTSINGGVAQNNYVNSNVSVFIISIGK